MNISVITQPIQEVKADLLAVNFFQGKKKQEGATVAVDAALEGALSKFVASRGFTGKEGETLLFSTLGKIPAQHVLAIGLGDEKSFSIETVRRVAGVTVAAAKSIRAKRIVSVLHGGVVDFSPRDAARAFTEGTLLADYQFLKYRKEAQKEAQKKTINEVLIALMDRRSVRAAEQGILEGTLEAEATMLTRDLVNEPASNMTPRILAEHAQKIAKENPRVTARVYGQKELERMGAGGILGISRGSDEEPFLIHLAWKPKKPAKKKVALCGKGITFDSGGISIKPGEAMYTMKNDMSGAAAILGVFSKIRLLDPNVEVHGFIGACENMPSGKAIKPGDVVQTISGKTIEVLHTDAEGRVVLADVLGFAQKQKPDYLIDIATLTGACVVALGEEVAGLMGTDGKLIEKIKSAAAEAGELVWHLPLPSIYEPSIKSDIADVCNITRSRWGGALTAGLFLKEFVNPGQSWAHLDIAGPAFAEKQTFSYVPKGGTGFAVRTLIHLLRAI